MSVKCPACGMDSPDGAAWCDFCKEPFQKKASAKPAASTPETAALKNLPQEELLKRLPGELKKDADKEKVEGFPPWLILAARLFLVFWVLLLIAVAMYAKARFKR